MTKTTVRQPRTARGEATRQKLLDAAEGLFGSQGYHATSVVDITREAGVGHGTFYLYFESKEVVFRELIRHLSHKLRATIREATQGLEDRLEIEETGIRTFFRFAAAHRDLYRIVFESEFIDPDTFRWYYERLAEGYARGLEEAMDKGQIRRLDPEALAYCLMGPAHLLGMRWIVWEGREPPPEAIETLMTVIRSALVPPDGAAAEPRDDTGSEAGSGSTGAGHEAASGSPREPASESAGPRAAD